MDAYDLGTRDGWIEATADNKRCQEPNTPSLRWFVSSPPPPPLSGNLQNWSHGDRKDRGKMRNVAQTRVVRSSSNFGFCGPRS